jgi:hypothetical protein
VKYEPEDLSAIGSIETFVEILDTELIEIKKYASVAYQPADGIKVCRGSWIQQIQAMQGDQGFPVIQRGCSTNLWDGCEKSSRAYLSHCNCAVFTIMGFLC